ncbi:hypothetical protein [Hoyosella subflava]|uniref:Uncharacterized protein n=1 Tax=Hoyosella subflava (strain DSM 45089 / JCM 17490 / NBRC 109087 / DQS3-9A1) TaxID=443218 RepID=F6ESL6_HOYSD|nr:hypothetical protein [Hoyosella subflava]AEF43137.1 hypothetical protein AS9A_P20093 [Hoyosella subflava DQS3-9A1]
MKGSVVMDLETYVGQVWSPAVRPLADEAWRCYNAGAFRASIAATWTAVTADIISKLTRLADDGDAKAADFRDKLSSAKAQGITPPGVRAMREIEDTLLAEAEAFEFIDSIGARELVRIREDRNLCVHPSLRGLGNVYDPRPEIARAHLAVALSTLLTHPPTQGRKVLEEFKAYICDTYFVPTTPHIQATFFDRVRTATRRNIVSLAAKHALLEIPPPETVPLTPIEHADRMATAVKAFALRDRELVRSLVVDLSARFQPLDGATQLRALLRLGDQDFFWDMVDPALASRINEQLSQLPMAANTWEPLPVETAAYLALIREDLARERLPILEQQYSTLAPLHRTNIAAAHPDRYFVPTVISSVKEAYSFRVGEQAGQLAVQHAPYLSVQDLKSVLVEWAANDQCRIAALMPGLAVSLFHATVHLGGERAQAFEEFLATVREKDEEPGSYYTYPDLERTLQVARPSGR